MANPGLSWEETQTETAGLPVESVADAQTDYEQSELNTDTNDAMSMMGGGVGGGMTDPGSWVDAINKAKESWFDMFDTQRQRIADDPCYGAALVGEALNKLQGLRSSIHTQLVAAEFRAAAAAEDFDAGAALLNLDNDAAAAQLSSYVFPWARVRIGEVLFPGSVQIWMRNHMPSVWPIPNRNPTGQYPQGSVINPGGNNQGIGLGTPFGPARNYGAVKIGSGIFYDRSVGELRGTRVYDAIMDAGTVVEAAGPAGYLAVVLATQYEEVGNRIEYWTGYRAEHLAMCAERAEFEREAERFPMLLLAGLAGLYLVTR